MRGKRSGSKEKKKKNGSQKQEKIRSSRWQRKTNSPEQPSLITRRRDTEKP